LKILVCSLLCITSLYSVNSFACSGSLLELINKGHDVYLGDTHGTNEIPALVKCLVKERLKTKISEPLVVALEDTSESLISDSDVWYGKDGRNSIAMWELVEYLKLQKKLGNIDLFMLLDSVDVSMFKHSFDQNEYEKQIGIGLRHVTEGSQVIALSGSFHSRKRAPSFSPEVIPAGSYVADSMLHISIEPLNDGEYWACLREGCKVVKSSSFTNSAESSSDLIDGEIVEHDYIYFLDKFSRL